MLHSSVYLNGACNVETLLHAGDVELDHSQVFAFDYDASQWANKSEREVRGSKWEMPRKHKLTTLTKWCCSSRAWRDILVKLSDFTKCISTWSGHTFTNFLLNRCTQDCSDIVRPNRLKPSRGDLYDHLFSMESMLEWSSHSSSVLSCLEERIRWWPVKHRVPSTVGRKGRCRTTPSTLGVFINSANSISWPDQKKKRWQLLQRLVSEEGVKFAPNIWWKLQTTDYYCYDSLLAKHLSRFCAN